MKHKCNPPLPMETGLGKISKFLSVYPRAGKLKAAHRLPQDQPVMCWEMPAGARFALGDENINPDLLIIPIGPYCPFCWQPLIEGLPEIAHLKPSS